MALPGQVIRVVAQFDREGLYVWHCHILSHEDHEMMRPFYVTAGPGSTPTNSDPLAWQYVSIPVAGDRLDFVTAVGGLFDTSEGNSQAAHVVGAAQVEVAPLAVKYSLYTRDDDRDRWCDAAGCDLHLDTLDRLFSLAQPAWLEY